MPNATEIVVDGATAGRSCAAYEARQGPQALAELLYCPPEWATALTSTLVLVVIVGAVVGFVRTDDETIRREVFPEMAEYFLVVLIGFKAVPLFAAWSPTGYVVDVLVGGVGSWLAARAVVTGVYWRFDSSGGTGGAEVES